MSLPLIKAKYLARAVGCSFGVSSKGNTQIAVTCEIVEHEEFTGHEITWLGSFTDKTTERTIESLQHMGWQGDDLSELEGLDMNGAARLLPATVELVCEPDTYEGETNLKVRWVNKPGAGRFAFKEPLTGGGLKAFAAQMRGAIRGRSSSNGSRPSTQAHPNAPGNKKDIPF